MKRTRFGLSMHFRHSACSFQLHTGKHLSRHKFTGRTRPCLAVNLTGGLKCENGWWKRPTKANSVAESGLNGLQGLWRRKHLSIATSELWLISHSRRERERQWRLRIYSAFYSWTPPFPLVNTGINLGPAAKAQPRRSLLPSYFTARQKDTSGRYRFCHIVGLFFFNSHWESEPSHFSTYTTLLFL